MAETRFTEKDLKALQAETLNRKILITQTRIIDWYEHFKGQVYISFSGGKDSTVLLDLARMMFPEIPAVFVNTGLEYPEIRRFAMSKENVVELRPRWGKMAKAHGKNPDDIITFFDTVSNLGYPVISKVVSNAVLEARRNPGGSREKRLHGQYKRIDGGHSLYDYSKYLPLYELPVRISDECCKVSKKGPAHIYQHREKRYAITGTMAEESIIRKQAWLLTGCNAFNAKDPTSKPMSFWTEQDVLRYIIRFGVEICSVYGDIVYTDSDGGEYTATQDMIQISQAAKLKCTGCERTGCIFCAFGCHLEKGGTRFQRLKRTHPQQYEFCIGGGEWAENERHDPSRNMTHPGTWNPKVIWKPNRKGLGMGKVFDMINEIYGKDFIRYE